MFVFILHDIYSNVKLGEFIDVVLAFRLVDLVVISKASSAAAQTGVPEAEKKAFMKNQRILYLPDLSDIKELLGLSKLYLIVPNKLSEEKLDFDRLREEINKERIGVAISGGDSSFTARELQLGIPVNIGVNDILPPSAYAGIILYNLSTYQNT